MKGVILYKQLTVSVVIPTLNEAGTIEGMIDQIPVWVDEVIIVDGNSRDDTVELAIAHQREVRVFLQRSKGKGAALSVGFAHASGDLVAIIDADGSMDFTELTRFLEPFPNCQIVKGSRYVPGGGSSDLTIIRSAGNRVLTKFANVLFRQNWTDMAYGYAVFNRETIQSLGLTNYDDLGSMLGHKSYGQGFEIETLMFTRAAKRGLIILEVPSFEKDRIAGSSNLRAFRDGFRVLSAILVEFLRTPPQSSQKFNGS